MGILDYFKKDAADDRKLVRGSKKLTNMYYQSADRLAAMDTMAEMVREGDSRPVPILLSRFEHLAPSTTADHDEKEYLRDLLVDLGEAAEPGITNYIRKSPKPAYWPLKVLSARWSREKYEAFFAEVLAATEPDYHRDPQRKSGLVQLAAEYDNPAVNTALLPFVADHHEDVRYHAIDTLLNRKVQEAQQAIVDHIPNEESLRVLRRILDGFAELQWSIAPHVDAVKARVKTGFTFDAAGNVKQKA